MHERKSVAPGMIRIGLVGCGTIAYWKHLRTLSSLPGVRVAGLADPDGEALARASRRVGAPGFEDMDDLLRHTDIDAVVIASPAGLHSRQLQAACAAEKHCYVEKPLAHDRRSLAAVLEAVKASNRVLAVGYNNRFHPGCQFLRRSVESGTIGEIRAITSHFTESFDVARLPAWRKARDLGGGVLLDLATHHVDLYRWLLQDELSISHAEMHSLHIDQDSAMLVAATRGGIGLSGYFAHGQSRSHSLTVHGTRGVHQLDLHRGRATLLSNRRHGYGVRSRTVWPKASSLAWRLRKRLQPSFDPSHALALRAFADAIERPAHRHPDLAGVEDGAAALRAVLEAEHSGVARASSRRPGAT